MSRQGRLAFDEIEKLPGRYKGTRKHSLDDYIVGECPGCGWRTPCVHAADADRMLQMHVMFQHIDGSNILCCHLCGHPEKKLFQLSMHIEKAHRGQEPRSDQGETEMITGKPMISSLKVEEVPRDGLPIVIARVSETDPAVKQAMENAADFTLEFTCSELDGAKYPAGRAIRLFSANAELFEKLAARSGHPSPDRSGNYQIDEDKLVGVKATLVRIKSRGKYSSQDTLTLK